jgi:hypothetical protein
VTCLNRGRDLGLRQDDQPTSRSEVLIRSGPVRVTLVNKRGLRATESGQRSNGPGWFIDWCVVNRWDLCRLNLRSRA